MKREYRHIFLLLSLFLLLSITLVAAEGTLLDRIGASSFDLPQVDIDAQTTKLSVANVILFLIYFLLVFDIITFLPFFENPKWAKWAVAGGVGILGFLFLDPAYVGVVIGNYEALAVALTSVIPFLLLFAFMYRLEKEALDGDLSVAVSKPISYVVLIIFALYLGYKLFTEPEAYAIWYGVSFVAVIVLFFLKEKIFGLMWRGAKKGARAAFRRRREEGASDTEAVHDAASDEIKASTDGKDE